MPYMKSITISNGDTVGSTVFGECLTAATSIVPDLLVSKGIENSHIAADSLNESHIFKPESFIEPVVKTRGQFQHFYMVGAESGETDWRNQKNRHLIFPGSLTKARKDVAILNMGLTFQCPFDAVIDVNATWSAFEFHRPAGGKALNPVEETETDNPPGVGSFVLKKRTVSPGGSRSVQVKEASRRFIYTNIYGNSAVSTSGWLSRNFEVEYAMRFNTQGRFSASAGSLIDILLCYEPPTSPARTGQIVIPSPRHMTVELLPFTS